MDRQFLVIFIAHPPLKPGIRMDLIIGLLGPPKMASVSFCFPLRPWIEKDPGFPTTRLLLRPPFFLLGYGSRKQVGGPTNPGLLLNISSALFEESSKQHLRFPFQAVRKDRADFSNSSKKTHTDPPPQTPPPPPSLPRCSPSP